MDSIIKAPGTEKEEAWDDFMLLLEAEKYWNEIPPTYSNDIRNGGDGV